MVGVPVGVPAGTALLRKNYYESHGEADMN
jgi:hypothetical protein